MIGEEGLGLSAWREFLHISQEKKRGSGYKHRLLLYHFTQRSPEFREKGRLVGL